jgi:hypothetical protein
MFPVPGTGWILNYLFYKNFAKISPKAKDTFLERLEFHLIRNLQLSISNIYIPFEDKTTKAGQPFAFGITLDYNKLHAGISVFENQRFFCSIDNKY